MKRLITVLMAGALLAGACTSDSDEGAATETTSIDDSTVPAESVPDGPPPPGVTDDTIRVGVITADFDALEDLTGITYDRGDAEGIYVAGIEAINERGGVHGRMIEIEPIAVLPVGLAEAEEACVRLTENEPVFAVVGPVRGDTVLCYTEAHETAAVVTGGMNEERIARSRAPYFTTGGREDQGAELSVRTMHEEGRLEGFTIGVVGSGDANVDRYEITVDTLVELGYEVTEGFIDAAGGDMTQVEAASDVVSEKFDSEGVDLVFNTSVVLFAYEEVPENGYEGSWVQSPFFPSTRLIAEGVDPAVLEGTLSVAGSQVGTVEQPAMADDPLVAACIDDIERISGEKINFSLTESRDNLITALNSCRLGQLLEAGLEAAGPGLTYAGFEAGIEGLGSVDFPGVPFASYGPGDHAGASSVAIVRFDADQATWVFESDFQDTTGVIE